MPELAEVEWYRKTWNPGVGDVVQSVELHATKRVFRETKTLALKRQLRGQKLLRSLALGKRMLFLFSGNNWLGVHLGMSGNLRIEPPTFQPDKHDHLVLRQKERTLVYRDARQFGRIRFHHGTSQPDWWRTSVPEIVSPGFSLNFFETFLRRHGKAPIKAVILSQEGFSGIGNWMADEILWRGKIHPARKAGALNAAERKTLWRESKFVARRSLETVGVTNSDPLRSWLIHQRWSSKGVCPIHQTPLRRATIGGRTTAWCPKCQPLRPSRKQ